MVKASRTQVSLRRMATRWRKFSIWLGWQWGRRSAKLQKANWLATTVIAAGVFTVVVGISTGTGLQNAIQKKVENFHGTVQIRGYNQGSTTEAQPFNWPASKNAHIRTALSSENIELVSASYKAGMVSHRTQLEGALLMGVSILPQNFSQHLVRGSAPDWEKNPTSTKVWISTLLAAKLQVDCDSTFEMYFSRDPQSLPTLRYFQVAGIYETGLAEWDAQTIFCNESQIQRLNRWEEDEHQALLIFMKEALTEEQRQDLEMVIPLELSILTARDDHAQLYQWLDLFDTNTWLLGIILTLVAAFNAAVVIFIRIIERKSSIAILRTMGFSSKQLMASILTLFSRSILTGMAIGNALAFILLLLQDQYAWLSLDPATYYVNSVPVAWNWGEFILANGLIFISVLGSAVLPVKILSKILPTQVLRMQ